MHQLPMSVVGPPFRQHSCSDSPAMQVHFLSDFSKVHGRSVQIGEDMMSLIATMDFKSPSNMFPMIRTAIWTTLLGCPSASIKDGIARNLVKSDIERLPSPSALASSIETEALLLDSWQVHQKNPSHHMDNCFGRLCIRCMVHVLNKGISHHRKTRPTSHWQPSWRASPRRSMIRHPRKHRRHRPRMRRSWTSSRRSPIMWPCSRTAT